MPENYYKSSRIQKKLPKLKDEQFEYTQMKINSHFLICGGTGMGKTNALYSYLLETSKGDELPFLKVDCYQVSDDVKFSRDFLEYLPFTPKV